MAPHYQRAYLLESVGYCKDYGARCDVERWAYAYFKSFVCLAETEAASPGARSDGYGAEGCLDYLAAGVERSGAELVGVLREHSPHNRLQGFEINAVRHRKPRSFGRDAHNNTETVAPRNKRYGKPVRV